MKTVELTKERRINGKPQPTGTMVELPDDTAQAWIKDRIAKDPTPVKPEAPAKPPASTTGN